MTRNRTAIAGDFFGVLRYQRRRTSLLLFVAGMAAVCVACYGGAGQVETRLPTEKKELQNRREETVSESAEQTRQQYINANGREEIIKSQKAWIADLKSRYGGTIDASVTGSDAIPHSVRFSKLMREWNPLTCTADDLKSIAGKPTVETEKMIEYRFDNGLGMGIYRFRIKRDRIHGIEYIPGE